MTKYGPIPDCDGCAEILTSLTGTHHATITTANWPDAPHIRVPWEHAAAARTTLETASGHTHPVHLDHETRAGVRLEAPGRSRPRSLLALTTLTPVRVMTLALATVAHQTADALAAHGTALTSRGHSLAVTGASLADAVTLDRANLDALLRREALTLYGNGPFGAAVPADPHIETLAVLIETTTDAYPDYSGMLTHLALVTETLLDNPSLIDGARLLETGTARIPRPARATSDRHTGPEH